MHPTPQKQSQEKCYAPCWWTG